MLLSQLDYFCLLFFLKSVLTLEMSDSKSLCSIKIRLTNCAENIVGMPKLAQFSDTTILWSLETLDSNPMCLKYENIETTWKVWKWDETHDELKENLVLEMFHRQTYSLQQSPLKYGIYKVKLTLEVLFSNFIERESGYCFFEIINFPIQTILVGGSLRKIFYKKSVRLEALYSIIPDRYELDNKPNIIFTWQCDDPKEKFCAPLETLETVRLISGPFPESTVYTFTLAAKQYVNGVETEYHPETQVINFTSNPMLSIYIKCLKNCGGSSFKTNIQEIVHLKVFPEEPSSDFEYLNFVWKYKNLGIATELQDVDDIQSFDNNDVSALVVKKNKLNENSKYLFVVGVEDSLSYAEIVVETDLPPSGIACEVNPKSGTKGTTFFTIGCKSLDKSSIFPSSTFEFYNRHDGEDIGRMLGYSMTGDIEKVILTRDKLFVRVTNFFGTSNEIEVGVELSLEPHTENKSSFGNKFFVGNYIYRMGHLSALSDNVSSPLFWVESTINSLNLLVKEEIRDVMGAILFENTLNQIACRKLVTSVEDKFQCRAILNVASIMYQITAEIKTGLLNNNINPRLMNTARTNSFVTSVLGCSSVILELNFLNQYKSSDIDVHECLKTSTFYTINSLDNLVFIIELLILPSIEEWYESKMVHIFVQEIKPDYFDNLKGKSAGSDRKVLSDPSKFFEGIQYYSQIIIFEKNPVWWGTGDKISTNVFSVKVSARGNTTIGHVEINQRLNYRLSFKDFQAQSVSGFVSQPDPNKGPEVIDFKVAVHRIIPGIHTKTILKFTNLKNSELLRVLVIKNTRPDFDLMNANAVNVTKESNELSFYTDGLQDDSFYYIGILPGTDVKIDGFVKYTFIIFSARCVVWIHQAWMSGPKCKVSKDLNLDEKIFTCCCTPLTLTIGGYLYVPANSLNPYSDLSLFLKIPDNPFIFSSVLVLFFVFFIIFFRLRVKDQDDIYKRSTMFLEDNSVDDTHGYVVGVFTGSRLGAGTTSHVGFKIFGEKANSRTHLFHSSQRSVLQCGSDDWFILFTPRNLGLILKIELWIDYSGLWPNWYCKKVFVCDLETYQTGTFIIEKWFGVNMNEICLKKAIKTASLNEINSLCGILSDNIVQGFRELHFFVSLFHKHPRSLISRTECLAVAFSCVLVSICVSIVLHSISLPLFEDVSLCHISSKVFVFGFISSVIAASVGLINMHYFRMCYTINRSKTESLLFNKCKEQYTTNFDKLYCKKISSKSKYNYCFTLFSRYIKTFFMMPISNSTNLFIVKVDRSKKNFAWMLTSITIVVPSYIIILSSLNLGGIKTFIWLISLLLSLVNSIFILLSIKVIFIALILAYKKIRIFDLVSTNSFNADNLNFKREIKEFNHEKKVIKQIDLKSYLNSIGERYKRVVKIQYWAIRIWVSAFILESLLLVIILYFLMDEFETFKYFYSSSTVCNEVLSRSICEDVHYSDTSYFNLKGTVLRKVLPKLFKTKWYNGEALSSTEPLLQGSSWLNDAASRLVGDPRILQVRVQRNLCKIPNIMKSFVKHCFPPIYQSTEDRNNYSLGWSNEDWTAILFRESPWVFKKGSGLGVVTPSEYYIKEGSYEVSLLDTLELARHVTKNLIDTKWIDQQSRIIVLAFLTYNPNYNIFTSSYFVTEVFPTHLLRTTHIVKSIGFYYHKLSLPGRIFILFAVVFFIRLIVSINIMGMNNFFKELWNCYDVFLFFVYLSSVIDYIQLIYLLQREHTVIEYQVTDKNIYLEAVFDSVQSTILALCYTLVAAAVRFVRITRINDRCREYLSDLVGTRTELFWTSLFSCISLYRQFRLIMFYFEPPSLHRFIDIIGISYHYRSLDEDYNTTTGKLLAFLLLQFSELTFFSFTLSLLHHHRQVKLRRVSMNRESL